MRPNQQLLDNHLSLLNKIYGEELAKADYLSKEVDKCKLEELKSKNAGDLTKVQFAIELGETLSKELLTTMEKLDGIAQLYINLKEASA